MLYRLTLSLAKMLKDRLQDEDDQNYFVVEFQVKRSVDVNGFQECKQPHTLPLDRPTILLTNWAKCSHKLFITNIEADIIHGKF